MSNDPTPSPSTPDEISLAALITALLTRRWVITGATLLTASVFAMGAALLRGERYTVHASVSSSAATSGPDARIRGLATQLGLGNLSGAGPSAVTSSPAVIVRLLDSPAFLTSLLDDTLELGGTEKSRVAVMDYVLLMARAEHIDVDAVRRKHAVDKLRSLISATRDRESDVVQLAVWSRSADASYQITRLLIAELNAFNARAGQAQASEERRFVEERIADQRTRLSQAEDRLAAFLKSNRQYRESPDLTFAFDRLQREVALHQQVLVGLSQSLEDVKIREVRDTPVLIVIEAPAVPATRDRRELPQWFMLGAILGLVCAVVYVAIRVFLDRGLDRQDPDSIALRETVRSLIPSWLRERGASGS